MFTNELEAWLNSFNLINDKIKIVDFKSPIEANSINIFPDEWLNRNFQVKNYLKSKLNLCKNKIHGRKCNIEPIPKNLANEFIENNHIQGKNAFGIVFFGLFYENELVGVVSLGKHTRQNYNEKHIVLDRLCFKDNVNVRGGSNKLLKACKTWAEKQKYNAIISFSDPRWTDGNVYTKMGFTLDEIYNKDYCYIDKNNCLKRFSKQSKKKTKKCPENLTELQWNETKGLIPVYYPGKLRWILNLDLNKIKQRIKFNNYYKNVISKNYVEFYCENCKLNHKILEISYDRNVKKNGKFLCKNKLINDYKNCSKCNQLLPLNAFGKDKSKKDGLTSKCRDCRKS